MCPGEKGKKLARVETEKLFTPKGNWRTLRKHHTDTNSSSGRNWGPGAVTLPEPGKPSI